METLSFCKDNNISPTIVFLGSKVNVYKENLKGLFEIAKKYNAILRMNLYRPTEGVNEFTKKFILPAKDLVDILRWIDENYTVLSISDALYSSLLTDSFESDPSGYDSLRILPNGDITPSTYLIKKEYIVGNISEKNILGRLVNEDIIGKVIHDIIPVECKNCEYSGTCKGGVYDRRYLWNKTLEKKDPYCKYEIGNKPWPKLNLAKRNFESVHHGYLPTMFFSPEK